MSIPDQNPQDPAAPSNPTQYAGSAAPSVKAQPPLPLSEKLGKLLAQLETDMYERETALRLGLLAAVAGESLFMLGPPGVAKSLVARRLKLAFKDAKAFEYLMNRFSTPDEIFGPVSISKLTENDSYERMTDAYLPGAEVVFLDEIWKAGPSIQNTLLTVLNEKIYRNGAQTVQVPMRLLVAASNELPAEGEGLEALYDRFLIRLLVGPLQDTKSFQKMIVGESKSEILVPEELVFSQAEFDALRQQLPTVAVPDEVMAMLLSLRQQIAEHNHKLTVPNREPEETNSNGEYSEPLYISDRRWKKAVGLLRASALMHDRTAVAPEDCFILPHVLWDKPEQFDLISNLIETAIRSRDVVSGIDLSELQEDILKMALEVNKEVEHEEKYVRKELRAHNDAFYRVSKGDYADNFVLKADYDKIAAKQANPLENLLEGGFDLLGQIFDKKTKTDVGRSVSKATGAQLVQFYDSEDHRYSAFALNIIVNGTDKTIFVDVDENNEENIIEHVVCNESKKTKRAPNPYTLKAWNDMATQLSQRIDQAGVGIETLRKKINSDSKIHLFASREHLKLINEGLARNKNEHDKLKTALGQIVAYYTNI